MLKEAVFSERKHLYYLDYSIFLAPEDVLFRVFSHVIAYGISQGVIFYISKDILAKINKSQNNRVKAALRKWLTAGELISFDETIETAFRRALIIYKPDCEEFLDEKYSTVYNIVEPPDSTYFDLSVVLNGRHKINLKISTPANLIDEIKIFYDNVVKGSVKPQKGESRFDLIIDMLKEPLKELVFKAFKRGKHVSDIAFKKLDEYRDKLSLNIYLYSKNNKWYSGTEFPKKPVIKKVSSSLSLAKAYKSVPRPNNIDISKDIQVLSRDTLYTKDQASFTLGDKLAEGGEGAIYFVQNRPDLLVKVYTKKLAQDTERKIERMLQIPAFRGDLSISYPQDLLYRKDSKGKKHFVGYLMNKVTGEPLHILNYSELKKGNVISTRIPLVKIAINYLRVLSKIHANNILLVDINDGNILVDLKDHMVSIVDLDSAQIEEFPCLVGIEDNLSKTMIEKRITATKNNHVVLSSKADEDFSVYVFVFKMLMAGRHPYDHKQRDQSKHKNILAHFIYPYKKGQGDAQRIPGSATPKLWALLTDELREVFGKGFAEGVFDLNKLKDALSNYLAYLNQNPDKATLFF